MLGEESSSLTLTLMVRDRRLGSSNDRTGTDHVPVRRTAESMRYQIELATEFPPEGFLSAVAHRSGFQETEGLGDNLARPNRVNAGLESLHDGETAFVDDHATHVQKNP